MSNPNPSPRRAYGTGSILEQNGAYFGKWRLGDRQIKRRLGPIRKRGTRDGLTKTQAEAELRKLIAAATTAPVAERVTVEEAGERLLSHLEAMGRKPSTLRSYRCILAAQIVPKLGSRAIVKVRGDDVEDFIAACRREGLAVKTANNSLSLLHSIFEFAIRRGWATENPCKRIERPRSTTTDAGIKFLTGDEIEAVLRAVPDTDYGRVQRVLYLAAAMTGMRQGELIALRWIDVDWLAQRIRVRRNYNRRTFGTPKSGRARSVPLADRLGGELDRLYKSSEWTADDDLVFANPHTGKPMNGNSLGKSFDRAVKTAGVHRITFHQLRHTFGTRMAAAGVPMRTLQELMGHAEIATTAIYAHYAPSTHEVDLVNAAFALGTNSGTNLRSTRTNSDAQDPVNTGGMD